MAKYDVTYSCGHAAEVQLYGPEKDRQRKLAYFTGSGLCKACYAAERKAADAKAPKVVHVTAYSVGGGPMIACQATGALDANADALKAIGFRWTDEPIGLGDMLSTKRTLAFATTHRYVDDEGARAWLDGLRDGLAALGYAMQGGAKLLDGALFHRAVRAKAEAEAVAAEARVAQQAAKTAAEAERQARIAANPKPARPDWYQAIHAEIRANINKATDWNGRIYGATGRHRIYVSGVERRISDVQKAELEAYYASLQAHRAAATGKP